jgi:hypothetical protein
LGILICFWIYDQAIRQLHLFDQCDHAGFADAKFPAKPWDNEYNNLSGRHSHDKINTKLVQLSVSFLVIKLMPCKMCMSVLWSDGCNIDMLLLFFFIIRFD